MRCRMSDKIFSPVRPSAMQMDANVSMQKIIIIELMKICRFIDLIEVNLINFESGMLKINEMPTARIVHVVERFPPKNLKVIFCFSSLKHLEKKV